MCQGVLWVHGLRSYILVPFPIPEDEQLGTVPASWKLPSSPVSAQRISVVTWKVLRSHLAYFLEHMEIQFKGERDGLGSYIQSDVELRVELGEALTCPKIFLTERLRVFIGCV